MFLPKKQQNSGLYAYEVQLMVADASYPLGLWRPLGGAKIKLPDGANRSA
jgi:hypothetical protein